MRQKNFRKGPRPAPSRSSGRPGPKSASKPGHKSPARNTAPPTEKRENPARNHENRGPDRGPERGPGGQWLYGLHAVQAALANPRRRLGRAALTPRAAEILGEKLLKRVRAEILEPGAIDRLLPAGAVHQGAALEAWPLKSEALGDILDRTGRQTGTGEAGVRPARKIVLVLDQLSDPHNVGAILRTAAAFGVAAVVVQDRHAPPQSGALAKAASGALDLVPYVEVVNIARALDELAERGFWRIALAGDGGESLARAVPPEGEGGDVALVLGSEGSGIRRLVREHCEASAFIPLDPAMESLNVSNAAAIALYELRRT
jgi:23S rRNA (guanosine2251-2'-O)-methyltransferase